MTLQRDLTPEEHDRFMKSKVGEPITSFKVYETNMTNENLADQQQYKPLNDLDMQKSQQVPMINEKELREEFDKKFGFGEDPILCEEDIDDPWTTESIADFLISKLHSHTKEVVREIYRRARKEIDLSAQMNRPIAVMQMVAIQTYAIENGIDLDELRASVASLEDNKK